MLLITEIVPSLVVAPASTYADPSSTVAGLEPRIEIIGKIVSGGVAVKQRGLTTIEFTL